MLIFILIPVVLGLLIWAVATKNYAPAFIAIAILFAIISFIAGFFAFDHGRPWPGVVMMAASITALIGSAALAMRVQSSGSKHQKRTIISDTNRPQK
jgi:peptidoglycan/LPS O-acetylase OafA/YrhL